MAREEQYLKFKLTGKRKPVSFELPIASTMRVKYDDKKRSLGKKRIHYIQGAEGIFVDDYKGDEKSKKVFFEDGELKVNKDDKNLVAIVLGHAWNGLKFEQVDSDKAANVKLSKNALIKKALAKVDISNEYELKANAMILVGPHVASWSEVRVKAALEDQALETPEALLKEMATGQYAGKYVASLAVLRGVLVINPPQSAISWADNQILFHIPLGQDPITFTGIQLSANTDVVRNTLQTINEKIKRSYVHSYEANADDQVGELTGVNSGNHVSLEEQALEDARNAFVEAIGKVPTNKKNDIDWLKEKVADLK
jgi:hypothetical protein